MICNQRRDLRNHGHEDGIPSSLPQFVDWLFFSHALLFQLSAHKKVIKDHIESKLKHCYRSIESLHTKLNIMDTQLKSIEKSINTGNEILQKKTTGNNISHMECRLHELGNNQSATNAETGTQRSEDTTQQCDYLILSDSILQGINVRKDL